MLSTKVLKREATFVLTILQDDFEVIETRSQKKQRQNEDFMMSIKHAGWKHLRKMFCI